MKNEAISWTKRGVFICSKCGTKINKPAEEVRDSLREGLKNIGIGKEIRVMTSGCLNICPEGEMAAVIIPNPEGLTAGQKIQGIVFSPENDKEALLKEIIK